ncbi:NAD-dependent protein deacetylase, SIR2 family [Propionibacterium cyclohexanicum]|uniref:protein acetyllysine N-acetyltransferase n=1 Tax=Propionibacterium cyclohexanicum TaxID=64702 RepID=A0A1H9QGV7_9ACTN|nr:NAD-dependent protein deacetylase, SIR2 family [Propionibacterium cyclohexanicum]
MQEATELLKSVGDAVVLTGAGLSTGSGVPDYRGPGSIRATPMLYQDFVSDPLARQRYWARNYQGWWKLSQAKPNEGHRALARWERRARPGVLLGVITQNVDGLHEAAGTRQLITLHGRSADVVCLRCQRVEARAHLQQRLAELNPAVAVNDRLGPAELRPDADAEVEDWQGFTVPDCFHCGGLLKPDVVFFGETVPKPRVAAAFAWCEAASVIVVAGSSLTVMSGLRFVRRMAHRGVPIIIINHGATRADELATVRLDGDTAALLPALVDPAVH